MPNTYFSMLPLLFSLAALLLSGWKIWIDRNRKKEHQALVRTERAIRENYERNQAFKRDTFEQEQACAALAERALLRLEWEEFETAERKAREHFEEQERVLRISFMAAEENNRRVAEVRIQGEIESYVKLEKWREETWHRNLSRLEQASKYLTGTTSGVLALIDEGPYYNDVRMVQETARVLDVFGHFQSSIRHFAIPAEMTVLSEQLIGQITQILLTLSPSRTARMTQERKDQLAPLRATLLSAAARFQCKCGDFERDPSAFLEG